ncbi:MAG: hypothetical protein II868_01915, partial [Butyrivibrio sp.]|nr:hypothetical protein [Butyrivibrio sp.]
CTILAAVRDDVDRNTLEARREELIGKYGAEIELLDYCKMDVSSTMIRERLKNGQSVRYLLPEDCIEFIRTKSFYTDRPAEEELPSKVYIPEKKRKKVTKADGEAL